MYKYVVGIFEITKTSVFSPILKVYYDVFVYFLLYLCLTTCITVFVHFYAGSV